MVRACYRLLILFACLVFNVSSHASVYTEKAFEWLSKQQMDDGGLFSVDDISLPGQSTSETLEAYLLYSGDSRPNVAKAKEYLVQQSSLSTEFLARAVLQGVQSTDSIPSLKVLLEDRQNYDGGFGDLKGYNSSTHDAYWALKALDLSGRMNSQRKGRIVGYLLNQQLPDGSWGYAGSASQYLTARVAGLLSRYKTVYADVPVAVSRAETFLRNAVANGEALDTFLRSVILSSMSDVSSTPESWKNLANTLQTTQDDSGSWNNDVYITALAARALSIYEARLAVGSNLGVIRGKVVKAGSLAPVSNAMISVVGLEGVRTQANGDGSFVINGLSAGQYNLLISHPGFNRVAVSQTVKRGLVADIGNIAMAMASGQSVFSGRVTDTETGKAIKGARIELSGSASLTLTANADGRFRASDLKPGGYSVKFSASGYHSQSGSFTLEGSTENKLITSLVPNTRVLDDTPAQISGRLLNGETQTPLLDGSLTLDGGLNALSQADGTFVFSDVPRGSHSLTIQADNYVSSRVSFDFVPGSSGRLGDIALYPKSDTQAPVVTELGVKVQHAVTKQPLAGVEVFVGGNSKGITNASGQIVVSDISALQFSLKTVLDGYIDFSGTLSTSAFGSYSTTVELTPKNDETFTETTLSGVVTDQSGVAVAGAVVEYPGQQLSVTSDDSGRYTLTGIKSLSGSVVATRSGFQTQQFRVDVQQHGQYQLDIVLEPVGDSVFQVAYVSLSNPAPDLDENVKVKARVVNLSTDAQNVILGGKVQSFDGSDVITSLAAINPGPGGGLGGVIAFAPGETREIELPWNVGQTPAGEYSIVVNVVREDSISRALPEGDIYASGQDQVSLTPQMRIKGGLPI